MLHGTVIDMKAPGYSYTVLETKTRKVLANRKDYETAKKIFEINNKKDAGGCNSHAWIIRAN